MGYYLGIDLGSTTTKAVVIDEGKRIVGRGITNTRSNYHVATSIAGNEAMNNARFFLLRRAAEEKRILTGNREGLLFDLEANFRYLEQMEKLRLLKDYCFAEADSNKFMNRRRAIRSALQAIFSTMEARSNELFSADSMSRSQFFRDIVGSEYLKLADVESRKNGAGFEDLMGIYDKSIIKVENQVLDSPFEKRINEALSIALSHKPELAGERTVEAIMGAVGSLGAKLTGTTEPHSAVEIPSIVLPTENTVGTGYGRQRLPFKKEQIRSEILCHGLGAHFMFPGTRTVLDIGGQDTKAIQVDQHGIVTSFQMNDRCAAGCGRYLGYIADELNIGLHELGPLSLAATRQVRITSTCTVFAGAELRDRLSLGEARESILAGLHRSIVLRAMSLLARSGGVFSEFTFTGGVAKNPAVVKNLKELAKEHYGVQEVNINADSIYTGAIGAALFALKG